MYSELLLQSFFNICYRTTLTVSALTIPYDVDRAAWASWSRSIFSLLLFSISTAAASSSAFLAASAGS
jgi:hypothetical protein